MSKNMAFLMTCPSMVIKTGNTVNWEALKRSAGQSATEELEQCLSLILDKWVDSSKEKEYNEEVIISATKCKEKIKDEERRELKITVKIFIKNPDSKLVTEAIEKTLEEMDVTSVETVIISLKPEEDKQNYMENLKHVWKTLENFVKKEMVYTLGVSDLNKDQLQQLFTWAEIKPLINQMNLSVCCVIPPEMIEYAKSNEIQLLTHSDPLEILSDEALELILLSKCTTTSPPTTTTTTSPQPPTPAPKIDWKPEWVSRYSMLIKCRGIIKSKGFIIKAKNFKK